MALEDHPLSHDLPVMVVSFAQSGYLHDHQVKLSYRFPHVDGPAEDVSVKVSIEPPKGCRDGAEWVKAVLAEILLTM